MGIIEQATKRLEELARAGVPVPLSEVEVDGGNAPFQVGSSRKAAAQGLPLETRPAPAAIEAVETVETLARDGLEEEATVLGQLRRPARPRRESATVTLDLERLQKEGVLLTTQSPRSALAEEFRHIKRPLLRNIRNGAASGAHNLPLIMITSALAGEGKTFCAIHLATSIAAEIDTSVLLVDADVVRPEIPNRLGFQAGRGLLDLLMDRTLDMSQVLLKTNVPKLSVLPAGTRNVNSTELLASVAMEELIHDLATRYSDRVIIFDAPPLLVTTEARVLASRMGQVVLVVEASETPRGAIEEAFAAVEGCSIVLSILNKGGLQGQGYGYGGYYE